MIGRPRGCPATPGDLDWAFYREQWLLDQGRPQHAARVAQLGERMRKHRTRWLRQRVLDKHAALEAEAAMGAHAVGPDREGA